MPPRRPPPLNPTLFAPGGALGPGMLTILPIRHFLLFAQSCDAGQVQDEQICRFEAGSETVIDVAGSAPLPPLATSVHPAYVIDAHRFIEDATSSDSPDALYTSLPAEMPRPPVKSAVQVKMNVSAEPAASVLYVPFYLALHPLSQRVACIAIRG